MLKREQLTNMIEIQSFLGLVGYNQRFIKGFSRTAYPITQLTCKGVKFKWIRECKKSFQELKKRLTFALMVAFLKGLEGFVVYVCKERNRMKISRDTPITNQV
ncbi:hypothetical protein Peur_015739 [Populus x canadensis]